MRNEMFINRNYKNSRQDFVYIYYAKSMSSREVSFEKNKHRDSSTC